MKDDLTSLPEDAATLKVTEAERLALRAPSHVAEPEGAASWNKRKTGEKAGDCIGPYYLLEQLGEGGFGVVWRAEQREPIHREVALKVIKPGMDSEEIIARFEAERQALAIMDHPNIASVLDAGATPEGRLYFVMELVRGLPITTYCDTNKSDLRSRLQLFIAVCQAVQHAHQKAVLHRDLKPANVLVMEVDGRPVPKVIDFGIAKALGGSTDASGKENFSRTQVGIVIGTPQYMSPEQAGSMPDVDTRSDIYALGIILYELLTGQTPLLPGALHKAAMDEVLRLVRDAEPAKPSTRYIPVTDAAKTAAMERRDEPSRLNHAIRGDLDWIVLKALEKDRTRRYDTVNALASDLRRHLQDEPVSAGPPSTGYRLKKFLKRKKGLVLSSAALLLCLIGGVAATSIALWREQKALQRETEQRAMAQASEQRALQAAKNAESVATFLNSLLSRAGAEVSGGKNAEALVAAMDSEAAKVEGALGDQPEVQYRVCVRLASIYEQFNLHKSALPLIRRAVKLGRQVFGNDHEETLERLRGLAVAEASVGDRAAGLALHKECVERRRALGQTPQTNIKMLRDIEDFAEALKRSDQADAARALEIEAVAAYPMLDQAGEAKESRYSIFHARALQDLGRGKEALPVLKKLTARKDAGLRWNDMADLLREQVRLESALGLEAEALDDCKRGVALLKAQPSNWRVAQSLLNFVTFLSDGGYWDVASETVEEAIAMAEKPEHPSTLSNAHDAARVLYERQDKLEQAEHHARAAFAAAEKARTPSLANMRSAYLISLLDKRQKYAEGANVGEALWQKLQKTDREGEVDQFRADVCHRMATLFEHWWYKSHDDALIAKVRSWRERVVHSVNWDRTTSDRQFNLAATYIGWQMAAWVYEERKEAYLKMRALLLERVAGTNERALAAQAALASLLMPLAENELRQVQVLVEPLQAVKDDGGSVTGARLLKALVFLRASKPAEARALLKIEWAKAGLVRRVMSDAMSAMALEKEGQHAEAVKMLQKGPITDWDREAEWRVKVSRDELPAQLLLTEARKLILGKA